MPEAHGPLRQEHSESRCLLRYRVPTPGLTDGRVSGKKHSVSDAARTASLTDLRRWPGDGILGKKQSRNSDFGGRIPTGAGGFDAGQVAVRSSCWPPVVSAAAGGLAPVGFTQLPIFWRIHLRRRLPGRVRKHQQCSAMAPVRRPKKKCPHGRQRHLCRDCGGASICEHGRQRTWCRDCGGASCRDCGGASICEHGRQRAQCRNCGGTSFCEHGRLRQQRRDCGGSSFCVHGRRRAHCRDCSNFVC